MQLEEVRTKASIEDRMIKNDPYKLQREDELMQIVNEERAGADSLREALQTASAAQARLLALHSSSNFAKQHSNISME